MATLALLFLITYPFLNCDLENGWKGIKVFESDRADVERVFGKPTEGDEVESRYETQDSLVRILYSGGPCRNPETLTGGFNVRKGIVIQYDVVPKAELRIDDLDWQRELYERNLDQHVVGGVGYYNRRDAIRINVMIIGPEKTEFVRRLYFERSLEQVSKFGCKSMK